MANLVDDIGKSTAEAARKWANRQADATARYAKVLQRFGRGELSMGAYSSELAGLYLRESLTSAEEAVSLGSEWIKRAIIIIGGRVEAGATAAEKAVREEPVRKEAVREAKPRKVRAAPARGAKSEQP